MTIFDPLVEEGELDFVERVFVAFVKSVGRSEPLCSRQSFVYFQLMKIICVRAKLDLFSVW